MKRKYAPFAENIAESTAACLVAMVQGNLLAVSLNHWVIAGQTGLIAGSAASVAILLTRTRNRLAVAGALGVVTAVVDFFVHPGQFGPIALEAIVTGLVAAILSWSVGVVIRRARARTHKNDEADGGNA